MNQYIPLITEVLRLIVTLLGTEETQRLVLSFSAVQEANEHADRLENLKWPANQTT